ncbi:MAG: hypothetical protein FJW83_05500 [Actinobacteria bacterium]|nr:hypothetical protein [Actinomycetota bacterium]
MVRRSTAVLGSITVAAAALISVAAPAGATPPDVLIIHSYADGGYINVLTGPVVSGLTATGAFGTITVFDSFQGRGTAPTTATLAGIEVVIVTSDQDFVDTVALGDLLADFVDSGRRVIEATYSFACPTVGTPGSEWGIGGRWESGGYSPLVNPQPSSCADYTWVGGADGVIDAAGSPYVAGVTPPFGTPSGANGMNRNVVAVRNTATTIMSWSDNNALFAVGPNCVMGINIWPPDMHEWNDAASAYQLFANAATVPCTPAGSGTPPPAPVVQPAYTG